MTLEELIDRMMTIDGVRTMFKKDVLIFWQGESPIAHVRLDAFEYCIEYPKLYEMHLHDVLQIDQWLYDYANTEISERGIDRLFDNH